MSDRDPAALDKVSAPPGLTRHRLRLVQQLASAGCTERLVGSDDMVWSDEIYRILGLSARAVRPTLTLWRGRIHPDDQPYVDAAWSSLENVDCPTVDITYRVQDQGGVWVQVRELAERWRAATDSASWIVAALAELPTTPFAAADSDALGRMAGALAHDFNNLLTAILGNCASLLGELPPGALGRSRVMEIQSSAERGSDVVHKILAYGGCQVLTPKHLDLASHLTQLESALGNMLGEGLDLQVEIQPDLWPVVVDPSALDQAIVHLVLNAKDALAAGGTVGLRALNLEAVDVARLFPGASRRDSLLVEIADDGGGIPQDVLARIFDPFFTTKSGVPGAGLGLSMVQGFARQCEGEVRVESEVGRGTMVQILLPREGDPHQSLPPELAREAAPTGTLAGGGERRILLVDDDPAVRLYLREVLEQAGHAVTDFGNPLEALSMAEQPGQELDLLVTDVVMPELRGDHLAQEILRTHRDIAVVYVTGFVGNLSRQGALAVPGDALLVKPFPPEQLLDKVAMVASGPR